MALSIGDLRLSECLGEILGRKLPVERLPLPNDDPTRRRPDCTRARDQPPLVPSRLPPRRPTQDGGILRRP
jgi:hypothetical protein